VLKGRTSTCSAFSFTDDNYSIKVIISLHVVGTVHKGGLCNNCV